jgi:hypothetical protein
LSNCLYSPGYLVVGYLCSQLRELENCDSLLGSISNA